MERMSAGKFRHMPVVDQDTYRTEPQIASLVDQWWWVSLKVLDLVWSLLRPFNYRESS
jgi:hypothetical protein